ncbi:MAG TPA: glycosyltransferase family 39 protein [Solirubrobacteraceae bacterium]|nr:glycosyltransferase family 39 protein [Solirubrobacteraceae bacterium]
MTSLSRSLFTDEVYSLALAQRGLGHMVTLFAYEANGVLYSLVLWPLVRIFGTGEPFLRLPAVIAGTASIPAMWWAARQLAGRWVPLLAAGLLAVNPMAVWYSQQARAYAFAVLAGCLAFGSLARALARAGGRRAWIGYVVAMAALAYCELIAVPILLPAHALIAWRRGGEGVRRWLRSLPAVLACCAPLILVAAIARSRRNPLYWLPKTNRGLIESALQEFTGGFSGVSAVRWVTLVAGAALLAAALWRLRRADRPGARSTLAIAASWGLLPGALLLAVSFVEPVFWPRYAIPALPGLCLLAALAAQQLWDGRRAAAIAAASLACIVLAGAIADARQVNALQENWRPIAAWLRADRSAGEPTIVDNALVLPSLGYYDPAFRAPGGELIVQEWHDEPLPAGFVGFKDRTGYGSVPDGPPSVATFSRLAARGGGSVWMIVSEVDDALQSDPRKSAAVAWARRHCGVQVRESVGVWALHAGGCGRASGVPVAR